MGTVCAKRKCARKIAVFPYDVCMYIWTPLNPQTGILVKAVVFYERYHAPAIMLLLSLNVMFWNVHFRLVIKYIYFTTNIFKNGWMENKEISFFFIVCLWFIVELCYCYCWKGTRSCYIQWWSSFSLCILFNYIASLTGSDLWWLSARIDIGMLLIYCSSIL